MVVIHPHYSGRDKGAMYEDDALLVFPDADTARVWLIESVLGDGRNRSEGNVRYYAEHHVSYTPIMDYLRHLGELTQPIKLALYTG